MSRKILFRGKRVDNGEWIDGFYAKSGDKIFILVDNDFAFGYVVMKEVITESVGQFTGLTDRNGKRVFEGDIVIFNKGRNLPNTKCVPQAIFYDETNVQFTRYASPYATLQKDMMTECEVIGNIHDWENKKSID